MKVNNTDVIGDKCTKIKNSKVIVGNKEKPCVWEPHYEQLLNVEFDWDDSSLPIEPSVEGSAIKITKDMVAETVLKMRESKACGPSGIVIEMVKTESDFMPDVITDIISVIIKQEEIPDKMGPLNNNELF